MRGTLTHGGKGVRSQPHPLQGVRSRGRRGPGHRAVTRSGRTSRTSGGSADPLRPLGLRSLEAASLPDPAPPFLPSSRQVQPSWNLGLPFPSVHRPPPPLPLAWPEGCCDSLEYAGGTSGRRCFWKGVPAALGRWGPVRQGQVAQLGVEGRRAGTTWAEVRVSAWMGSGGWTRGSSAGRQTDVHMFSGSRDGTGPTRHPAPGPYHQGSLDEMSRDVPKERQGHVQSTREPA